MEHGPPTDEKEREIQKALDRNQAASVRVIAKSLSCNAFAREPISLCLKLSSSSTRSVYFVTKGGEKELKEHEIECGLRPIDNVALEGGELMFKDLLSQFSTTDSMSFLSCFCSIFMSI